MAIKPTAIIEGAVVRIASREVTAKDGQKYTFRNMLVIGENTLADVRIGDAFELPKQGASIRARVGLSSYRNDAELELEAWL